MAENIVTTLQERLGFQHFEKIDPNIPQGKRDLLVNPTTNHYTQAAVIAVLVGIYKYGSSTEGAADLLTPGIENDLFEKLFGDNAKDLVEAVSYYGDKNYQSTHLLMQVIAKEAIEIIRKAVDEDATPQKIVSYITGQRHHILVYLPPDLKLGKLINDNSIDDTTNKMEGPVSGLVHFF
jgi:hypothetical protein